MYLVYILDSATCDCVGVTVIVETIDATVVEVKLSYLCLQGDFSKKNLEVNISEVIVGCGFD